MAYKANTRRAILRAADRAGLRVERLEYLGQYPCYFMFNGALFFLATGYEKLISHLELFTGSEDGYSAPSRGRHPLHNPATSVRSRLEIGHATYALVTCAPCREFQSDANRSAPAGQLATETHENYQGSGTEASVENKNIRAQLTMRQKELLMLSLAFRKIQDLEFPLFE